MSKIKELRISLGMTQQLADSSRLNIRQVQKLENGERDIGGVSMRIAIALADAVGVSDLRELM